MYDSFHMKRSEKADLERQKVVAGTGMGIDGKWA